MTTHVHGYETLTIFDQRASQVEAYEGHGVLSMYPHMHQVSS